jgi:hypothetical protein
MVSKAASVGKSRADGRRRNERRRLSSASDDDDGGFRSAIARAAKLRKVAKNTSNLRGLKSLSTRAEF